MNIINDYTDEMVRIRRSIHAKPETGWTEFRTTSIIVNRLKELGFKVPRRHGCHQSQLCHGPLRR